MPGSEGPRFVPKVWDAGRGPKSAVWGVYDRKRASWPISTAELGEVIQQTHEDEAVRESDRLNEEHGW